MCKECNRLPKEERDRIDRDRELDGLLDQSRISPKNVGRLRELSVHPDATASQFAQLIVRVAEIAPGKRKRWRKVGEADRDLLQACRASGLVPDPFEVGRDDHWDDCSEEADPDWFWGEAEAGGGDRDNGLGWERSRSRHAEDETPDESVPF